jgi:GTP pyrophosphokinase
LSASRCDVLALNTQSNRDDNTANLTVTVEISDLEQLAKLLSQIRNLPNVIEAKRKR